MLRCLLFDQVITVEVAYHNFDTGVLGGDLLCLLLGSYESCVFVLRMLLVKRYEGIASDVASDTSATMK